MLSVEWYRENMPRYKAAFEDGSIEVPKDPEILADHRMLRMEKGMARIPDRRIAIGEGGQRHGDSAVAGALAWYASAQSHAEYNYRAAEPPSSRGGDAGRGWWSRLPTLGRVLVIISATLMVQSTGARIP